MLDREEAAGAGKAALNLVTDEDDAVLVADLTQSLHELERRRDEPTLALHRLEHDRGDVLGRDDRREGTTESRERLGGRRAAECVRVRHAVDLGGERAEAGLVRMGLRGQGERQIGAPMERTL